jgi:hypothetical protein
MVIDRIKSEMLKFTDTGLPNWFGDDKLHSSHRRALLYKNFDWYKQFDWKELPDVPNEKGKLNYFWPK